MERGRGPSAMADGYSMSGSQANRVALNPSGSLSGGNRFSVSGPVCGGLTCASAPAETSAKRQTKPFQGRNSFFTMEFHVGKQHRRKCQFESERATRQPQRTTRRWLASLTVSEPERWAPARRSVSQPHVAKPPPGHVAIRKQNISARGNFAVEMAGHVKGDDAACADNASEIIGIGKLRDHTVGREFGLSDVGHVGKPRVEGLTRPHGRHARAIEEPGVTGNPAVAAAGVVPPPVSVVQFGFVIGVKSGAIENLPFGAAISNLVRHYGVEIPEPFATAYGVRRKPVVVLAGINLKRESDLPEVAGALGAPGFFLR